MRASFFLSEPQPYCIRPKETLINAGYDHDDHRLFALHPA